MNQSIILPKREDVQNKNNQRIRLTPLEHFILYYEPDSPSTHWRELLADAIEYEIDV